MKRALMVWIFSHTLLLAQQSQPAGVFRFDLRRVAGTNVSATLYDTVNFAFRVNCVVGCSGGGLTDAELRATPVPVSGTVTANAGSGTMAVSGPLTDTQLRATAIPVSGTFWQATQPVSLASVPSHAVTGPLTDAELRAAAVPVSLASVPSHAVTGPLTDTQLRAAVVPVTCDNCGGAIEGQTYVAIVEASAAAASKDHLTVFNASGSGKVLKIRSITINPDLAAAIVGLTQSFDLIRVTTAGATCTAITIQLVDSTNAAVTAQVTAVNNCTTDPTTAFIIGGCSLDGEDARSAIAGYGNCYTFRNNGGQPWTLREGQGLMIKSSALSGAWPVTAAIEFTM